MLLPSAVLLRRKTPYVVKYLEGVPVPTKLIDHIAGADLSSSTAVDFFTTVPRYVNTTQEQRLSKLFFHHVLYGAGGARGPTQVVVVRNGRTVVPSTILQLTSHSFTSKGHKEMKEAKDNVGQRYTSKDPMAVPLSQRGACSPAQHTTKKKKNILVAEEKDEVWCSAEGNITPLTSAAVIHSAPAAAWSRVDAARRPYFYIPRLSSTRSAHQSGNSPAEVYAGRYAMATPRVSTWHAPRITPRQPQEDRLQSVLHGGTEASDTMNTLSNGMKHAGYQPLQQQQQEEERKGIAARATQDSALTALCGVIQGAFAERTTSEVVDLLAQLAVNESAGILNSHYLSESQSNKISELQRDAVEKTKEEARRTRINGILRHAAQQSTTSATDTHAYLQVHLPPAAITVMPLPNNTMNEEKESEATSSWLCRLAGGVEPRVTFAVGTPLTATNSAAPLAHLTCLVRVNMHRTNSTISSPTRAKTESHTTTTTQVSVQQQQNKSSVSDTGSNPCDAVTEPWRLGDALDPALPTRTRTLVERIAHSESEVSQEEAKKSVNDAHKLLLLGRTDAETYLLPQRELLVTVYVPRETVTRVAEQNAERIRRQTQARQQDNALPAMGVAWPSATRLTAERGWHGQLSNLRTAEGTRATDTSINNNNTENIATCNNRGVAVVSSLQHYEIRALPGDVLYIPRGWQYRVRRIIGTALLEPSNRRNDSDAQSVRTEAVRRVCTNTALGLDESAKRSVTRTSQTQQHSSTSVSTQEDEYVIDDIEVDALCLMYRPYPLLTKDQARVYVAANYVQGGIEAFYRNGGNDVYYPYE